MSTDLLAVRDVLTALAQGCASGRAANAANTLAIAADEADANRLLDETDAAARMLDAGFAPAIPNELDHRVALRLAGRGGVLDREALRGIGSMLAAAGDLQAEAEMWREQAPSLAELAGRLPRLGLLANLICDAIDERGELLDEASDELARLRAEVRRRAGGLRRRIAEMVRETDEEGLLQDDYYTVRDGRFVLPVKASDKRVLGGIVHGSSQTGQTVYIEPQEMVEANNALALASDAVKREEHRILAEFSASVAAHADAIERTCAIVAELDLIIARARLARRLSATRPQLGSVHDGVRLRALRHPKLVIDGASVVANDVAIEAPAQWLIVSGPNGGGKTVLLTAVGLAVEMARRGLHVCAAEGSKVPFVTQVAVVLGDAQDLDAGLSTFSGHLQRVAAALEDAASGRSLVLLDELASGTEPLAGSALARSILESFAELPCVGLVSTHFEALKLLPLADERYANAALALDAATLSPTFRLRIGAAGSSSPLALAARMGLPDAIVDRARTLLGAGSDDTEMMLERLEKLTAEAEKVRREATAEAAQAAEARRRLDEQRRMERIAINRRIEEAAKEALDDIRAARDAAKAARKRMRRKVSVAEIDEQKEVLRKHEKKVQSRGRTAKPKPAKERRKAVKVADLKPGDAVFHSVLNRPVEVISVDVRRGKVRVKAGVMEMGASADQLFAVKQAEANKAAKPKRRKPAPTQVVQSAPAPNLADDFDDDETASFRTSDWTCDLRGMRVDEAIHAVDSHLDRAVVSGVRGVCIVHGHGTGALRKAVTEHLRKHRQVKRSRLGDIGEGGAGATMVWMVQ